MCTRETTESPSKIQTMNQNCLPFSHSPQQSDIVCHGMKPKALGRLSFLKPLHHSPESRALPVPQALATGCRKEPTWAVSEVLPRAGTVLGDRPWRGLGV